MTTTIAAAAASHTALKASAWGLCAALAAGGTAAVTGNLPDGAQKFCADLAARIGLNLPRPDTEASVRVDPESTTSSRWAERVRWGCASTAPDCC